MSKTFLLGLLIIIVLLGIAGGIFAPVTILPLFGGAPTCEDASVTIYNGDFDSVTGEASLDVRNMGRRALSLEVFVTRGGEVEKHPMVIYLSGGGKGIFTLEDMGPEPEEITLRDSACGVSDLWKF